ncbi:MAG: hypothetical protein K0R57_1039 [Paenibacillaceae bacterium]|jgi:copper chaperone CopZ|nr:hypothetical protein [Paenibacillaceae bacterium]
MFGVKKHVLKQLVRVKVVHSIPGRLRLKLTHPGNGSQALKEYEQYVEQALKLLPGITSVSCNGVLGTILLEYDAEQVYEGKIVRWANKIIEIGIEQSEFIAKYSQDNLEHVVKTLDQLLREGLQTL